MALFLALAILAGFLGLRDARDPADAYARELPSPSRSLKGDVVRTRDGKQFYFDGRRWTDKAVPPRDLPF